LVVGLALATTIFFGSGAATSPLGAQAVSRPPVAIGDQIAGSFGDATGHSAQSHLVYAVNSRVWWLFTLTSTADSEGGTNHVVKTFRSSCPDLATATCIAVADSPAAAAASANAFMEGGFALGIAYLGYIPIDYIHAGMSMAFDGQEGRTGK